MSGREDSPKAEKDGFDLGKAIAAAFKALGQIVVILARALKDYPYIAGVILVLLIVAIIMVVSAALGNQIALMAFPLIALLVIIRTMMQFWVVRRDLQQRL